MIRKSHSWSLTWTRDKSTDPCRADVSRRSFLAKAEASQRRRVGSFTSGQQSDQLSSRMIRSPCFAYLLGRCGDSFLRSRRGPLIIHIRTFSRFQLFAIFALFAVKFPSPRSARSFSKSPVAAPILTNLLMLVVPPNEKIFFASRFPLRQARSQLFSDASTCNNPK
jgi:hypothetical protein